MDMKSYWFEDKNIHVLELAGRFDAYETPPVKDWLDKLNGVSPQQVVVNLKGVNFIDSTALATLARGLNNARQADGNLYLCNLAAQVHIIFELSRMDLAFGIYGNQTEAVAAFERKVNEPA
jgi:anti-sigma B factor antagonist